MEIRQGATAIDAAQAVRVPHVVLTSVASADEDTGIPPFGSKAVVERHLKGSALRHTISRPVAFMDTFAGWWAGSAMETGTLAFRCPRMRPGCSTGSGRRDTTLTSPPSSGSGAIG